MTEPFALLRRFFALLLLASLPPKKGTEIMKIKYQFATETVEIEVTENWGNAIVVAIPFSGHGLNDLMLLKFASICCVLVLPALI